MKRDIPRGPEGFRAYYRAELPGRWTAIEESCTRRSGGFSLRGGLKTPFFLDEASVMVALALEIHPGLEVADFCAAPGGKSLVIALRLFGIASPTPELQELASDQVAGAFTPSSTSRLRLNERSSSRRNRLKTVIQDCVPDEFRSQIEFSGDDATRLGIDNPGTWDRILLDVPCSSERHLMENPKYLEDWSPNRTSSLAQQAYAMGLSAARGLKDGGILCYSTCSFSSLENEKTLERILERTAAKKDDWGYELEEVPVGGSVFSVPWLERSSIGYRIWPDRADGRGPLYFALLRKKSSEKS